MADYIISLISWQVFPWSTCSCETSRKVHLRLHTIWASLTPSKALRRAVSVETSWDDFPSCSWKPRRHLWSVTGSIKNRIQKKYSIDLKETSHVQKQIWQNRHTFLGGNFEILLLWPLMGPPLTLPKTNSSAMKKRLLSPKEIHLPTTHFSGVNSLLVSRSVLVIATTNPPVKLVAAIESLNLTSVEKNRRRGFLFGSTPTVHAWVGGLMVGV